MTDHVWVALEYEIKQDLIDPIIQLQFMNNYGITVFSTVENDPNWDGMMRPIGRYRSRVRIPPNLLTQGELRVSCIIKSRHSCTKHVDIDNLLIFGMDETDEHRLVDIAEKPSQRLLVNAGIYALNPGVLSFVPSNRFFDMPQLFSALMADNRQAVVSPIKEYWLDVGRLEELSRAHDDYDGNFSRKIK